MFYIGCHLSSAKGYMAMGKEAVELGCNVFQFFTRNPRGGSVKPLDLEDLQKYNAFHKEKGFGRCYREQTLYLRMEWSEEDRGHSCHRLSC